MEADKSFLGRGWAFPPTFNIANGEVAMVAAQEDIEQSLAIIFSTSLGERVLRPDFGCNLNDFQFEPINASLLGLLRDKIEHAVIYHEPRIKLRNLEISEDDSFDAIEGKLKIGLEYSIRGVNSRFNFVYDFYLREGVKP